MINHSGHLTLALSLTLTLKVTSRNTQRDPRPPTQSRHVPRLFLASLGTRLISLALASVASSYSAPIGTKKGSMLPSQYARYVNLVSCITCLLVVISMSYLSLHEVPIPSASSRLDLQLVNNGVPLLGYVVADDFREQLSRAMVTFYQLAEIAAHWKMKIVEPHMSCKSSGLTGLPDLNARDACFSLGDFYNVSTLYKELDHCLMLGGHKLVTGLEDFLVNASARHFVALNFFKDRTQIHNSSDVFDCTMAFRGKLAMLQQKLNHYFEYDSEIRDKAISVHGRQYKFKGVQVICVTGWRFSINHVTSHLITTAKRLSLSQNVTLPALHVVIPEWREIRRSHHYSSFFYSDLHFSWIRSKTCNSDTIPHAKMVLNAAQVFLNSLNLSHPIIGIHIRMEKLGLLEIKHHHSWKKCLQRLKSAVHSLKLKFTFTGSNIVAIHDQGKYASSGCQAPTLCPRIKADFLSTLDRLGGRVVYYEPTDFGERADKGFVSLVEKEFLSRVDHLLTLGEGSYQRSVVLRFQKRNGQNGSYTKLCGR